MGVSANTAAFKTLSGMLKLFCWVLTVILVILARVGFNGGAIGHFMDAYWLTIATFCSMTIVLTAILICYLLGDSVPLNMEAMLMLTGGVMMIASGALAVEKYQNVANTAGIRDAGLATGSLAIIDGMIMLVDTAMIAQKIFG